MCEPRVQWSNPDLREHLRAHGVDERDLKSAADLIGVDWFLVERYVGYEAWDDLDLIILHVRALRAYLEGEQYGSD